MFRIFVYLLILVALKGFFKLLEQAVIFFNKNKLRRTLLNNDAKVDRFISKSPYIEISLKFWHMIATVCLGVYFIVVFYEKYFFLLMSSIDEKVNDMLAFTIFVISLIIITIFAFVITELIPKRIAIKQASALIRIFSIPISIIYTISKLIVFFCMGIADFLMKLLNISDEYSENDYSEEEIRMMVDASRESGNIDESEIEMINNVFEFDNKTVGEIATHRTEIVAINADATKDEIIKIITEEKYSRMPVYEENIDNIIGILHIKDILEYLVDPKAEIDLRKIIRKAHFLPESKKNDELFQEMQKNRVYMVIIVDEYGGTSGIVTMEDLTEEIVGNISDEYDEHEVPDIEKLNDSTFFISGVAEIVDVAQSLEIGIDDEDEFDTISGFLTGQLGFVPEDGEKYEIEYNGVIFKINNVQDRRIISLIAHKKF